MNNIIINKESDYKDSTISSIPLGINNFMIDSNFDFKKDEINNIKPMLSNNSNTIHIPQKKKVKIKPTLNRKIPVNTFSGIANPKKNFGAISSDEESVSTNNSLQSESNDILSNNSKQNTNISNNQQYSENNENENEDEDDDYSSLPSKNNYNKSKNNKDDDSEEEDDDDDDDDDDESSSGVKEKKKTYEEIQQEKQKMLFNLERLQKQGYPPSKRYSMASSYEDMQFEHDRLKKQRDVEKSIKFSRKFLMAFASGIEFLNGKFDPFDIKLEGWSENIMENVSDYDEVFEELHEKYGESVKMAPELKLISMVAGSGFMFHLTNSLFKSAGPKLGDILKNNPDIMRNISEAAAKNMNTTINQEFGQNDIIGNMMKSGIDMKMGQQKPQQRMPQGPKMNQPKMNGPVGIDELLNELNNGNTKDNESVSSSGSINIKSTTKRTKMGKKGIQLDLR